ncbi:hypothetical protein R1flu_013308 [Riccia fluitans]|uniref:AAA+ ATPase domain-containing protein n=1 Tax=Riccia fluitans TaxID=41844 RepID=A0ABD1YD08_9MARC
MDRVTRQPSESVSDFEPESSGVSVCRKLNDSVYELYRPSTADMNIDIDIVFFHGLQLKQDPTPYLSTWRARDAERSLWPSKWLAEDFPTARILSVDYDGSMKKIDRDGRMDLDLVAESLLHALLLENDEGRLLYDKYDRYVRYLRTFTFPQEDHFSICQPRKRTNTSYQTLVDFILRVQHKRNISEDFGGDIQSLPKTQVGLLASWYEGEFNKSFEEHQAIGLWGMCGIGKTTLAKAIFNRERSKFYYTLFVRDVKTFPETEKEFEKLFLDHTFCKGRKVENISDISIFRNKDILVVLDDVEKDRDVKIVTDLQNMCSPRSRFVLTSRDRLIMQRVDGLQIIEITLLDDRDSEKLFRSIAVPESEEASEEWQEDCLKDIVKYCRGLPLILKVIGQYLKTTQEKGIWKQTLESLWKVGEGFHVVDKVLKKLQVSYDQLGKEEKEMFMDVATIFSNNKFSNMKGRLAPWTLAEAKAVWRVVHGNEDWRWKILVDRALVCQVTDEDSELKMNEHLRALGRKLARDEGRSGSVQYTSVYHISKMVQEKARYNQGLQQLDVRGEQLDVWGEPSRPKRSLLQFAPSISFRKMQNLRYLQVSDFTDISEGLRLKLPESLVIFESRIPIESCSFQPNTQLAVLLLGDFRGRYLPDSFSNFKDSLQFLNFRAERLESLPERFSRLKMLRECALYCPLVRELPGSFGSLESLKKLMLECASLERLPDSFGNLDNLKELKLHDCHNLERLPDSICRLRELHMMELFNCRNLEELPTDIGCLENIRSLIIENDSGSRGRGKLQSLPDSLGNLRNLQRLSVVNTDLKELPSSIGDLQCLEHLTVSNKQLQELPASPGRLEKLQVLERRNSSEDSGGDIQIWNPPYRMSSRTNRLVLADRVTRQPSESVSDFEPESSGVSVCRKLNDSVYELYRPSTADMNTDIDIVFFHGLQLKQDATPYLSTWRARDAERSLWPSKWLAEDYPTARILSVDYDGSMKKIDRDGRMDLDLVAESLLHALLLENVGQSRPVILVGHSFGGLVIKKLCVISADQAPREKRPAGFTFFNNITGIFFYATPHQGSRLADVEKFDSQEGEVVSVVRVHNTELARLNENFESLDNDHRPWDIGTASVGGLVLSDMDEGRHVIAEEASARHPGTFTVLQEDHFSICQPQERTNTSYQTLVHLILRVQQKRKKLQIWNPPYRMSSRTNRLVRADRPPIVHEEYTPNCSRPSVVLVLFHSFSNEDQPLDYGGQGADKKAWRTTKEFKSWLSWLSKDFPDSRILSICYPNSSDGAQSNNDSHRLDMPFLYDCIVHEMGIHSVCPVILIADSLGCFVVQETCLTAQEVTSLGWLTDNDEAGRLLFLISGIIFLLPSRSVETRSTVSKTYLEQSRSRFWMLRSSRNWKTVVLLDKESEISKSGVRHPCSWPEDVDFTKVEHEVDGCRPCQMNDPLYESSKNFLQSHLDELRRNQKSWREQNKIVGLDRIVRQLTHQVQDQDNPLHQLGLTGEAGVGKTTLAKAIFESLKKDIAYTCFLEAECEEFEQFRVAQRSLRDIILKHMKRWGREEHSKEWRMLEGKKVLLVLDDVDLDILEHLSRISVTFDQGSWIVCTSRIQSTFECSGFRIHKVQPLQKHDSLTLFTSLAFQAEGAPAKLQSEVEVVTQLCGGSPLLIRQTAQHLRGGPDSAWTDVMKVLMGTISSPEQENLAARLVQKLENVFKSLAKVEKEMFLDLAICFRGEDTEETLAALRGMYPGSADSGWENLLDRSLIEVVSSQPDETPSSSLQRGLPASCKLGVHEEISVHEALRLLGRRLCREKLHQYQRVSNNEAAYQLLQDQDPKVQENVRIIKLDEWKSDSTFDIRRISTMKKLKTLWLKDVPLSVPEFNPKIDIHRQLSSIMIRLSGQTIRSLHSILTKLEFSLRPDPESGFKGSLLPSSGLQHLSLISAERISPENKLQETTFSGESSAGVRSLTPFQAARELPVLDVESLLHLEHLVLDMGVVETSCLPETFGQLKNLRFLQISNFLRFQAFPSSFGNLSGIEVLKLKRLGSLETLPESLGDLRRLKRFEISDCARLESFPDTVGRLTKLDTLMIRDLKSLEVLPESVGELRNLNYLELSELRLLALPAGIGNLPKLAVLVLRNFNQLMALPDSVGELANLQYLELQNLPLINKLPDSFGKLGNLSSLRISSCWELEYLPDSVGELANLQYLELQILPLINKLPDSLGKLGNLSSLRISSCGSLEYLPDSLGERDDSLSSNGGGRGSQQLTGFAASTSALYRSGREAAEDKRTGGEELRAIRGKQSDFLT